MGPTSFASVLLLFTGALCNASLDSGLLRSLSRSGENVAYSPASVGSALGMVYLGAKGQTADQLGSVLGLPADRNQALTQLYSSQHDLQVKPGDGVTWQMANRVMASEDLPVTDGYREAVQQKFGARVDNFDFSQPARTAEEVNSWVANVTHNYIDQLVTPDSIDPDARLILLNAVYFYGKWKYSFNEQKTMKDCFYMTPGQCTKIDMMTQKQTFNVGDLENLNAKAIRLPYADEGYSMVVVLPNEEGHQGLNALVNRLDPVELPKLVAKLPSLEVEVSIPKFNIEFYKDLTSTVKELGAAEVFGEGANLSLMVKGPARVSQIIHKCKISVTEQGTTAAAATGVQIVPVSLPLPPPPRILFRANRPFLYFVLKNPSTVLFGGQFQQLSST